MKLLKTILIVIFCMTAFSGCEISDKLKSNINDIKGETQNKIDNVKEKTDEIKSEISEAKDNINQKIEDVKTATHEVNEAIEQLNQASEAIGNVVSGTEENTEETGSGTNIKTN